VALPPGPRAPSPVQTALFMRWPRQMLTRWHRRYGDAFTTHYLTFGRGIYVSDPAAIRELFTGDQSDLLAGDANSFLEPLLGKHSVLVLDGPEHLRQRRLLLPPFQGSRVNAFRSVVRDVAEREVGRWHAGDELVMRDRMRSLTFEVISHAVFGVTEPERVERLRAAFGDLLDSSTLFMAFPLARKDFGPWSPGRRFARRLRTVDELLYEEIARRRGVADLEERTDVLSLLMLARDEDGRPMSDAELRDELVTMLGAGHETTATSLAFAVELLTRHPRTLARLREAIAQDGGDAWLEAVMRETMRLCPVIDAAERTLTKPRRVAGFDLPAGVKVYPAIYLVHQRPDLFPDPDQFKPERFLATEAESYSWLPFGGGIRRCIGAALAQAEMVEALRVIVPRVELEPLRPKPDPVVLRGVTLAPKHGVRVRVVDVRPAPPALEAAPADVVATR
jgi:cytochrome P450